jgi:hypothetical protein
LKERRNVEVAVSCDRFGRSSRPMTGDRAEIPSVIPSRRRMDALSLSCPVSYSRDYRMCVLTTGHHLL